MKVLFNTFSAAPHLNIQTQGGFGGYRVMYMRDHKTVCGVSVTRIGVRGQGYETQILFRFFSRTCALYI